MTTPPPSPPQTPSQSPQAGPPTEKPTRRELHFDSYDDVAAEAKRLLESGYDRAGNWTLAQNCLHLAMFMNYSMDGFPGFKLPWPITAIVQKFIFSDKKLSKPFPVGLPTAPFLKPADSEQDAAAVDELTKQCERLKTFDGPFARSPIVGKMSADKWTRAHLRHCEMHLGHLVPN